jgi:hypothetical protein
MKRLADLEAARMTRRLILAAVGAAALAVPASANATIHPLMLGWYCGNASGEPPGQTPGETHSDQSTFRALQATGVVTFTSSGDVVLDLNKPESKFSTFDVATETGTPSSPGALNCASAP